MTQSVFSSWQETVDAAESPSELADAIEALARMLDGDPDSGNYETEIRIIAGAVRRLNQLDKVGK